MALLEQCLSLLGFLSTVVWLWRIAARKPRGHSLSPPPPPPLPPGPQGVPVLGYLPFLGTDLPREFAKLARLWGPIYKFWLGSKLCVVVTSPSLAKQVFRDHDVVFANHDLSVAGFLASFGGNDIVVSPYGPQWKKLRRIFVHRMLSNTVLDSLYSLRREEVHKSIKQIFHETNGLGSTTVDIGKLAHSMILNALLSMFWGDEVGRVVDRDKFRKASTDLGVVLGKPNVFELFPALTWLDVQGIGRETKRVSRVFEAMFDSAIKLKQKMMTEKKLGTDQSQGKKDFLEFLLELSEREDEAESITIVQIKGILMDVLIGGSDSTVTTVEWAMAELLNHRDEMRKVQQELAQVVGLSNMVEEFHLTKLLYLRAVIKETLRLHPPFPLLLPRAPSEATTIGGYCVPKGAKVFINAWAIHRDPHVWENPSEFIPERFLRNDAAKLDYSGKDFGFVPFGSGRRICAGIPVAERVMTYVIASLLHSFAWELPRGERHEMSDLFGIVVRKRKPLIVVPRPRLSELELYTSGYC